MFAFIVDDILVIDLACGFGWCGSPAWYFLPGALINGLYENAVLTPPVSLQPPLSGLFWCDDHTCIEVDRGMRCVIANLALRRAINTVLGPSAINKRKFTNWSNNRACTGTRMGYKSGHRHDTAR
ncbi:hypothetical protein PF008_g17015 [Phytophthora fragariae]|uniref:Reverse transcriptase domain-containing protein n=1 Tax=Phytophthora fragariae TaxID=53985 RepID=A0A6G0RAM9_9STRA|nr:hypothetical protein PF008_g17015 [Phytophthora fragariae]